MTTRGAGPTDAAAYTPASAARPRTADGPGTPGRESSARSAAAGVEAGAAAARRGWSVVALSAALLGALATWNSAHKSLWIDEAYSEYTSRLPVVAAAGRALRYELQGPLYFALLSLWRHVDTSVMWGRGLSTLAAMLSVVVIAATGRRAGLTRWWWVAVAAAAMPGVVWAASELRMYAFAMLLSALSLYFWVGIVSDSSRVRWLDALGYVAAATALLYSFYYGGFILAGQWLATLVLRRRVVPVTALLAVVGCALLPLVRVILWQVGQHPIDTVPIDLTTHALYALFKTAGAMIGAFEGRAEPVVVPHVIPLIFAVAVGVPVLRTVVAERPWDRNEAALTVAALFAVCLLGLLRFLNIVPVHQQHFLAALPGLVVIYGLWVQRMAARWSRVLSASVLAAGVLACLVTFERSGVQREDWRAAARYVAAHAAPGEVVLVFDPDRALPFDDYFAPSPIPVYGVPVDMDLERYNPFSYAIRDTAAVSARLASVGAVDHPLWFITATRLLDQLKDSPGYVRAYLDAHGRVDVPVTFDGVSITHFQPR